MGLLVFLLLALACDEPRAREAVERPTAPTPAADPVEPAGTPIERWDPREATARPEAHVGEERTCHVAFAERLTDVTGRERTRYTIPVVRRIAVQCATEDARGWADLVFREERAAEASRVAGGSIARVRVVAPDGGFAGYPVLELVSLDGTAELPAAPADGAEPEPGFDFGRAVEPGVVGTERACAVDFAGRLEIVDDRTRGRHAYPEGTSHRIALKCRHADGDAWVDLALSPAQSMRALAIGRGDTVEVRVLRAEGGYADRPVATFSDGA